VFDELENKYLSYFSKAEEVDEAKAYYKRMREKLISKAKKLRGTDFSNISGAIGENIEVGLFNDNSFGITAYDVGEQDETQLVGYAKTLCDELDIANNQISPMTHRQATAK
jgi:pentatricopeptide repeat protein